MTDFTGLEIAGRIATAEDSNWDEARAAWNLAADQRPEAVVFAESADDVAATVRFAAESGLRVAPRAPATAPRRESTGSASFPAPPLTSA